MTIEQLEGIANVTYSTTQTVTVIADEQDWNSGTLTETQVDLFSDTLTVGWNNQANSPSFFSRLDAGSGDPIDVSGNNNDAQGRGSGTSWTGQTFRGTQRLEVDGSTDGSGYVNFGDIPEAEFGGTDFTIEVWYYFDSNIRSLGSGDNSSLWNKTYGGESFPESQPWYLSRVGNTKNGDNYVEAEAFFRNGGDYDSSQTGTGTDTWRHHALRYDASATNADVLLNGGQVLSFGVPDNSWGSHGGSFIVGMHTGNAFPGSLANVRITKSYLSKEQLDYISSGTANGYSQTYGSTQTWSSLDFSGVTIPTDTSATVDLESLDGGTSQGTLSVSLSDASTSYDISSLANGDEIRLDFTLDVTNNLSATPRIEAPVDVTSASA